MKQLLILPLACILACSTTATIRTKSGEYEGQILGRSGDHIYVKKEDDGIVSVRQEDVRDISHPGTLPAILGGLLGGYGIVNIAVGLPECRMRLDVKEDQAGAFCIGVFLPVVLGAVAMAWGLVTRSESTSGLERAYEPANTVGVSP